MTESMISIKNLHKVYHVPVRSQGVLASVKSLLRPVYNDVNAVEGLDFEIKKGEMVGFIGPNGAGKTTTLKMLSGLLYPTSGNINVAGFTPHNRERQYLKKIGMVMGNKSQLNPSITVEDSMYVTKEIYHISDSDYKRQLEELVELLDIKILLPKLARNLSLGERAKCEFANALLYRPEILFLDEPTLGMDVSVQIKLRRFIKEYNEKHHTTILITSHYMADITSLCSRILLINHGKLLYDGDLETLSHTLSPFKQVKVTFEHEQDCEELLFAPTLGASIIEKNNLTYTIRVQKEQVIELTTYLLTHFTVLDLSIENPAIEAVIDQIYQGGEIL